MSITGKRLVTASLAGLGLLAVAGGIGASIFSAPQIVATILLTFGFFAYASAVVVFAHAWSRGSDHPSACWVRAVSLGLVGLLSVVLMGSFGRGIALADQGESSWLKTCLSSPVGSESRRS